MNKRKRLVLVNPANPLTTHLVRRESLQPPLGLGIVAGLTPKSWSVHIIDENFNSFRFREADLVGITALTSTASRAYEIAAEYRSRGIPTVLGGIHATLRSEEASGFADTIVTGEAETVWEQVISDFEKGELKPRYHGFVTDLKGFGRPRFELFHPGYIFGAVQTTRGCPMNCDFCSVPIMCEHTYRLRDVDDVLDELEAIPHKLIYFVDDNILGAGTRAREHGLSLFRGMIERKIRKEWYAYVPLSIGRDEEWIRLAAKSGCRLLLIGIEAEKTDQLKGVGKKLNISLGVESIQSTVRLLHKYGISVLGSFIFGMENDTRKDIRDRLDYMLTSPFDITQPNVMTPFPGTPLFDRIHEAGLIFRANYPSDWKYYHGLDLVYRPGSISPAELKQELRRVHRLTFRKSKILARFIRSLWNTRSFRSSLWAFQTNISYRQLFRIIGD